jgi:LEA14-like dessication related protein
MRTFLASLACLVLCGCGRMNGPSVNLVSVHFKEATALETTAVFTLRLSNETPEPVQFNGEVHTIYLNGLYIGKGLSSETVDVPRLGTVTNNVTVHLSNLALATRIKPVIESKSFDYRIQSVFYGKSWFSRTRSVSEGRLDLKDFTPTPASEPARPAPESSPTQP